MDSKTVIAFYFHLVGDNVIATSANDLLPQRELLFLPALRISATAGTDIPRKLELGKHQLCLVPAFQAVVEVVENGE